MSNSFSFNRVILPPPQFNVNAMIPVQNVSITNNITFKPVIPQILPTLFMPQVCMQIQTPSSKIFTNAPYMYDIMTPKNQPESLVTLKTMHNNISSEIFDGTIGIRNPIETIAQNTALKTLEKSIESHCYPQK